MGAEAAAAAAYALLMTRVITPHETCATPLPPHKLAPTTPHHITPHHSVNTGASTHRNPTW